MRAAQESTDDGEIFISVNDIPYEFDFLEDRYLFGDMLAERPEIAFVKVHGSGFTLRVQEQVQEQKPLEQAELDAMNARHALWLLDQPDGVCADFAGQILDGLYFDSASFPGADFTGATIEHCSMDGGTFTDCDFTGAFFRDVTAHRADFDGAHFNGAQFEECTFQQANLRDTTFAGAKMEDCDFNLSSMRGADFSQAEARNCTGLEDCVLGTSIKMGG